MQHGLGLHHLQERKASRKLREMSFIDRAIYLLAIGGPLVMIPQVAEVWVHHNAAGISVPTWMGFGIINLVWICYGAKHRENPIIISNALYAVLNFGVALGAIFYG